MSEELETVSVEGSSGESFEGSSSDSGASEVEMQERMLGNDADYWLDEGLGTYTAPDGEPLYDENGNRIETKEALDAFLKAQNAKTEQKTENQQQQTKAKQPTLTAKQKLEKLFTRDESGNNDTLKNLVSYTFKPSLVVKPAPQQQQMQGQQPQPPVDPKTQVREEFTKYKQSLEALIEPLELAAEALQAQGAWTADNPQAVKIDAQLQERRKAMKEELENKLFELNQNHFESEQKKAKEKELFEKQKETAEATFKRVASQFGGDDALGTLLFGETVNGKSEPGVGSDLVSFAFEMSRLFNPEPIENIGEEYTKFWAKLASNENYLMTLAKFATSHGYVLHGSKAELEKARQAGIKEANQKKKFIKPTPNSTQGGSFGQNHEFDSVMKYAGR